MSRVWWTALCLCCWFWRQKSRKRSLRVSVRNWWSSVKERDPPSGCNCMCHYISSVYPFSSNIWKTAWLIGMFCYRLSNLFHGMDENTPVRYTVFCSLIKVAATCNAIAFIPTDLDQVGQLFNLIQFIKLQFQLIQRNSLRCIFYDISMIFSIHICIHRCASGLLTGTWTQRRSTYS